MVDLPHTIGGTTRGAAETLSKARAARKEVLRGLRVVAAATACRGLCSRDRLLRGDVVIYGATANGTALCCDATLVSPLTRTGQLQPCTADVDGAALRTGP